MEEKRKWAYGTPKKVLEPLIDFWLEHYDWRAQETILNQVLPQFRTTVSPPNSEPLRVHFVHKRSTNENAIPLLFCHGWPGSFLEVSKIISVLTEAPSTDSGTAPGPDLSGAAAGQIAFHVVAPSIPGFGFSDASTDGNFGLRATSDVFDALMKQLGYSEYVAHGSDWCAAFNSSLDGLANMLIS
jgi:pimeloyl-ACP methyl ester carboxylesterase